MISLNSKKVLSRWISSPPDSVSRSQRTGRSPLAGIVVVCPAWSCTFRVALASTSKGPSLPVSDPAISTSLKKVCEGLGVSRTFGISKPSNVVSAGSA